MLLVLAFLCDSSMRRRMSSEDQGPVEPRSEHLSPFDIEVLSQLPPELRLKIWGYAMSEPRSIQLQIYRHYSASGGWLM